MESLKKFRENLGKTQEKMAKDLGISKSFYEKIEIGAKKPGWDLIKKFKIIYS